MATPTKRHMRATGHPADALPFTYLRNRAETKAAGGMGRCWWRVEPTGNYEQDCNTGTEYGLAYLSYEAEQKGGPGALPQIVGEMPRDLSGIEVGFLTMVTYAAAAGKWRAQQVAAYWDRKMAEREAVDA